MNTVEHLSAKGPDIFFFGGVGEAEIKIKKNRMNIELSYISASMLACLLDL